MTRGKYSWFLAVWLASVNLLLAEAPNILNYQGRIMVADAPFNGQGNFTFVILDSHGVILWASGEFPIEGTTKVLPTTVKLAVNNGVYSVRLGDTSAGMPALDGGLLRRSSSPQLRVWFNDGTRGWERAGDDVSLATALGAPGDANGGMSGSQAEMILREIQDLRTKLDRVQANPPAPAKPAPPEPTTATVSVNAAPSMGSSNAPLVLVEFTDYQCVFCKRFQDTVMADLIKNYIDTGKVRIFSRNLPLSFHPNAEPAAEVALCAYQQKQYWPMRDKLFAVNTNLGTATYQKAAEELKLDMTAFYSCVDGKTFASQVANDAKDAGIAGISGTPSFVLGTLNGDKVTGKIIVGAQPYGIFEAEIKKLLAALPPTAKN